MVNNSININKTNNHLSSLESLTHHLSSWLTTWAFDSPLEFLTHLWLEFLTHHLSPWLTTWVPWVLESPFEFLTHHLSSWLTTWVLDSPLEFLLTTWVLDSPLESLTHHSSSWLTTWVLDSPLESLTHHCVWDSPFCAQNNKECTSGTCDLFLVGTRQHFILQGSPNLILIILDITLISFIWKNKKAVIFLECSIILFLHATDFPV